MREDKREDATTYRVVVNSGGWYSIHPATHESAPGWEAAGGAGTMAECVARVCELLRGAAESGRAAEAGEGPEYFVVYTIRVNE